MILWDGSRHPWLEDRGPRLCLMAAIDDATGELLPGGHFVEQEWRPCPDKHTVEALCALQYVRVVANNNTVRIGKQVIDIPRRSGGRSTYAKALVTVRHRLDGRYLVYFGGEVIARAKGPPPKAPRGELH